MGFTYLVERHPALSPRRSAEPTRLDATATAQRVAATTGLPSFVYLEPAHRLWATVDPNGSIHPIDPIVRQEV